MTETKCCTKCGRELPLSEFSRLKGGKNGLRSLCNECNRAIVRAWQKANKEKIARYQQEYRDKRKQKMKTLAAREREARRKAFAKDVLGGYTIYILNYPTTKSASTTPSVQPEMFFKTNSKAEFLQFVQGL